MLTLIILNCMKKSNCDVIYKIERTEYDVTIKRYK